MFWILFFLELGLICMCELACMKWIPESLLANVTTAHLFIPLFGNIFTSQVFTIVHSISGK